ncbi:helix-turn-helix domain-containing protein [Thermogymnomonas acidicola]|uniref:helix-turn-helix domain-containing protein n=1 Tax=Thermogymnomonas acidicola TaxID=399579 RepID=UPI00166D0553|nr:helix-turn-helix domain-containing protein [Thermogymnomonas acidicola]
MILRVTLRHIDCWSTVLSSYDGVVGELLNQNIGNDSLVASVVFHSLVSGSSSTWASLVGDLKSHPSIYKIRHVETIERGRSLLVQFVATRNKAMSDLVGRFECPAFREYFHNGLETWVILSWADNWKALLGEISSLGEVARVDTFDQRLHSQFFFSSYTELTGEERKIIESAFLAGFYRYPRTIKLEDLAISTGKCKSDLSRRLRRITGKLIARYLLTENMLGGLNREEQEEKSVAR